MWVTDDYNFPMENPNARFLAADDTLLATVNFVKTHVDDQFYETYFYAGMAGNYRVRKRRLTENCEAVMYADGLYSLRIRTREGKSIVLRVPVNDYNRFMENFS